MRVWRIVGTLVLLLGQSLPLAAQTAQAQRVMDQLVTAALRRDTAGVRALLSPSRLATERKYSPDGFDWAPLLLEFAQAKAAVNHAVRPGSRGNQLIVVGLVAGTINGKAMAKVSAPNFLVQRDGSLTYVDDLALHVLWATDKDRATAAINAFDQQGFLRFFIDDRPPDVMARLERNGTITRDIADASYRAFYAALTELALADAPPPPRALAVTPPPASAASEAPAVRAIQRLRDMVAAELKYKSRAPRYGIISEILDANLLSRTEDPDYHYTINIDIKAGTFEAKAIPARAGNPGFIAGPDGVIRYDPRYAPPGQAGRPVQ